MKISVRVKAGRKKQLLIWDGSIIMASISARAQEGQANKQLIEVLADLFEVPKTRVRLIAGNTAPHKRLEVDVDEDHFKVCLKKITPSLNSQLL